MLATDPVSDEVLPCPTYCRWGYDYAQQDPSGRLFVGGGRDRFLEDEWTIDTAPTLPVQQWIDDVATRIAGRRLTVRHRWGASVGYTEDGRALVTEVLPGVVACGGYSGTGNLVGPIAADMIVSTIPAQAQTPELLGGLRADAVFEVRYDPWPTPIVATAGAIGATVVGGLDLLVHQAVEQLRLMTGIDDVPLAVMRAAGERELAARAAG